MTDQEKPSQPPIAPDEKIVPVMVYIQQGLCWGNIIVKEQIRASIWFRTSSAPDVLSLYEARLLTIPATIPSKPQLFSEIHIRTGIIQGFHLIPPAKDPLDYDPEEHNFRMEPVVVIVGEFRFEGKLRLSAKISLQKYLDLSREIFCPLYEVEISSAALPSIGVIRVPYCNVRLQEGLFSPK